MKAEQQWIMVKMGELKRWHNALEIRLAAIHVLNASLRQTLTT